jgi:hypothetical protein
MKFLLGLVLFEQRELCEFILARLQPKRNLRPSRDCCEKRLRMTNQTPACIRNPTGG